MVQINVSNMDHPLDCLGHLLWMLMLVHFPLQEVHGFFPNIWSRTMGFTWGSITHQDMTEDAILNVTLRLFSAMPHPITGNRIQEEDFKDKTLLADDIFAAFYGPEVSAKRFRGAVAEVANANAAMDFGNTTRDDPVFHFDSELIQSANSWLLHVRKEILQAVRSEQYGIARKKLGQLLHSLQDFYSHSNWVELGYDGILLDLVQPGREIQSVAEAGIRTCHDCSEWTCKGNLLEKLAVLTTGYYGTHPEKPTGKCSHGGRFDESRHQEPRGGINKDSASMFFSPHHYLHQKAARLAQEASIHFLEKMWREIGSRQFMRLLDISPTTGLSFVVDTTGSMGEEISAAKFQAREIIKRRQGTLQQPDFYLLVPFHDPGFGPVSKTRDPDEFWKVLNTISPLGGGDEPEMCLSALELALQNSPPYSEIFVFTDASAKDAHLKNSVESLIQEKKCKVTFLITEDPSKTRTKRETLAPNRFDLYVHLAESSGGQIIFTDNDNIRQMAEIIGESSLSSVTLFRYHKGNILRPKGTQRRTKKQALQLANHQFWIDSLVDHVVVTIQGSVEFFEIRDPTDRFQTDATIHGPLAKIQYIGGIYRAFLSAPVHPGEWTLKLRSKGHYSVYIQGRSTLNFLYYFAVPVDGRHPGLFMLDSPPVEGLPTYLVVMAIGLNQTKSGSVQLQSVNLEARTGSLGELKLQRRDSRMDLFVAELPPTLSTTNSFSIVVHGMDGEGQKLERSAPQVATVTGSLLELSRETPVFPGRRVSISWKVTNPGAPKYYGLKVISLPRIPANISNARLQLGLNQTGTGHIFLNIPDTALPGSLITITLQASSLNSSADPDFAHMDLLVMPQPPVETISSPVCNVTSSENSCGPPQSPCRSQRWRATLQIWDKAGLHSVQVENGPVLPHQAHGLVEVVTYTSDCCSRQAELVVTNLLGEKYRCQVEVMPPALPGKRVTAPPEDFRMMADAAGAADRAVAPSARIWWWISTILLAMVWLGQ
ncbi:von Willebrand factor A domain-containing protein 7 isoform X1 [Ahaetulla prasina]|uniref:von Willebrand factor A domain-containing protein 7 isoform X1 n=3 Tax=Ahaetulla prasina TaxID=499056 RepID=UPI002648E911|nr:von Willebrand factor A domain-containing protein 7 isoform X1 [Ahaetulla prasina]